MGLVVDSYRFAAAAPPAFDPETDITWHSLFWAEGSAFTALGLSDTDAVTTWPNETGESDAARQSTTVIYDASHASFNGQPVVNLNSTGYLAFTSSVDPTQPTSLVVVAKWASLTSAHIVVGDHSANVRIYADSSKWYINNGSSDKASTSASDTNPHMMVGLFSASGNETLTVDGTAEVNAAAGASGFTGQVNIGAGGSGNFKMNGDIAFVGFYQGDITVDGEWANFEQWVDDHYGITIA